MQTNSPLMISYRCKFYLFPLYFRVGVLINLFLGVSQWPQGSCSKTDCPWLHVSVKPDAGHCLAFLRGYCAAGTSCTLKHYTLGQIKEEKRLVASGRGKKSAAAAAKVAAKAAKKAEEVWVAAIRRACCDLVRAVLTLATKFGYSFLCRPAVQAQQRAAAAQKRKARYFTNSEGDEDGIAALAALSGEDGAKNADASDHSHSEVSSLDEIEEGSHDGGHGAESSDDGAAPAIEKDDPEEASSADEAAMGEQDEGSDSEGGPRKRLRRRSLLDFIQL